MKKSEMMAKLGELQAEVQGALEASGGPGAVPALNHVLEEIEQLAVDLVDESEALTFEERLICSVLPLTIQLSTTQTPNLDPRLHNVNIDFAKAGALAIQAAKGVLLVRPRVEAAIKAEQEAAANQTRAVPSPDKPGVIITG